MPAEEPKNTPASNDKNKDKKTENEDLVRSLTWR